MITQGLRESVQKTTLYVTNMEYTNVWCMMLDQKLEEAI